MKQLLPYLYSWLLSLTCVSCNLLELYLFQTPLQLAVITHQCDLVELLLDHGADPCSVYDHRSGNSLLHIASRDGDSESLKLLINHWHSNKQSSKWSPEIDTQNFEGKITSDIFASLYVSTSMFVCLSFSVCVFVSLSMSLYPCVSFCVSVSVSISVYLTVSLCLCLCVYVCVFVSLSVSLCLCLCLCVYICDNCIYYIFHFISPKGRKHSNGHKG